MATQTLDITTTLKTTANVSGIFNLDNKSIQTVTFDDTNVSSATVALTTSYVEYIAASVAKVTYVYIKNLDTTNHVLIATAAPVEWGRILPGESMVFSVAPSVGMDLKSNVALNIEYALFRAP
tara:strand:+ start:1515 stop:1883 length:369 start_codon:yes stop_codon:yes gene_type:complete